jgi:hypothetical protein
MFEFIRKKFAGDDAGPQTRGGRGIITELPEGRVLVNLERYWWAVECGRGGRYVVRSAAGREVFDDDEHRKALREQFLRFGSESPEVQMLNRALQGHKPLIVMFPSMPVIRADATDMLEEFLKRRLRVRSTRFELIKLFLGPVRPHGEKICRKFRGRENAPVVLNLSGEGLLYLHYGVSDDQITIDALDPEWPISPSHEQMVRLTETRIRRMDPSYFGRLREGIEHGPLLVYLPEHPPERLPVLATAARLLKSAPGGEIDLDAPGVIRFHRTNRDAETSSA